MTDDAALLRCYAEERSEEAFAEFVQRHLGLVYAAALRRTSGDEHDDCPASVAALEHRESVAAVGHVVAPLQRGYVPPPSRG